MCAGRDDVYDDVTLEGEVGALLGDPQHGAGRVARVAIPVRLASSVQELGRLCKCRKQNVLRWWVNLMLFYVECILTDSKHIILFTLHTRQTVRKNTFSKQI